MSGILATIKAIFDLIQMARSFSKMVEENKNEKWWQDFSAAMKKMNEANTPEERKNAISDYARSLAGL